MEENNKKNSLAEIELSLELGKGFESDNNNNKRKSNVFIGFTIVQFQELQIQAMIFKYISFGLPVPNHLLMPIWQSFSRSLPTCLSGMNEMLTWESRKGSEKEPWRCRRTDGKKWRCSKEALPQHKYCQKHLHRGRQRCPKPSSVTSTTSNITDLSFSSSKNASSFSSSSN